jgi:fatty acid desaturase
MDNNEKRLLQEKVVEQKMEAYVFIATILWVFFIFFTFVNITWYWALAILIPSTIIYLIINIFIFTIVFDVFITSYNDESISSSNQ